MVRMMAAGAVAVLALSACGGNDAGSGDSAEGGTYNWGVDSELSGNLSFYGASIRDGVAAYVEQVNAQGGINGHKIELTALDNAGEQSRAAANATQLATANKVNAIFGYSVSASCAAVQPIAERYKVPTACLSVAEHSPYIYNLGADNARAADAMFAAAKEVTGKPNPKAAVVHLNTLTGIALAKDMQAKAASSGVTVATTQEIDLRSTDTSGPVAQVVAAQPDVVLISQTGPGLLSILKGVRAAGVKAPFVWVDGTANFGSLAQSTDEGVYAFNIWQMADPASTEAGVKEYIEAITPKLKDGVTAQSVNAGEYVAGYATARAFGEALKACGYPCSGEQLKAQLDKVSISLPGLLPEFGYTADDHYPYKNWYLYHIVGTKTELVSTIPATAG